MKISALIVAHNEEKVIADAIDSVTFCDEVIVLNNASTDRTGEVAKQCGAKVFEDPQKAYVSYAQLHNTVLKKAKSEWVLYLDADERITPELQKNILDAIEKDDKEYGSYELERQNYYLGKFAWPQREFFARLFRRETLHEWKGDLHETAYFDGKKGRLPGLFLHFTHEDLANMLDKTIHWSTLEARFRLEAHHPRIVWWRFFRVFLTGFWNSFIKQKGYTIGTPGLVESIYQGYSMFITYAKVWEQQTRKLS